MAHQLVQQWLNTPTGWKSRGRTTRTATLAWEYSDSNVPWSYSGTTQAAREAEYFANWPAGWSSVPTIVDIQTGGADFRTNVLNTIAANGRCIIRLPAGTFHLTSFVKAASDEMYAFGLWHTNLAGFVGAGADQTFIQMDAGSMNATQLAGIATLTSANVNNLHLMRLDGEASSPAVLAGLTLQAQDQQTIASFAAGNSIAGGQPAPHGGVLWYKRGVAANVYFYCSHVRARGAGRACTSLPPFEHANFNSQYEYGYYFNTESDGRRAAELDAARPRRCGIVMGNNASVHSMVNCWLHHTNVSRYAMNDQNATTSGAYTVAYCKVEHITDTQNTDPALNGGASLGGYTNATLLGWETCNGTITVHHSILCQDNTVASGQTPCHFQMTTVGSTRGTNGPQGGRLTAYDNEYRHAVSYLSGFLTCRIAAATHWYIDGYATTISSKPTAAGSAMTSWSYTTTRFATSGEAAALDPATRYIVNQI